MSGEQQAFGLGIHGGTNPFGAQWVLSVKSSCLDHFTV
jgi:hypothetical protein